MIKISDFAKKHGKWQEYIIREAEEMNLKIFNSDGESYLTDEDSEKLKEQLLTHKEESENNKSAEYSQLIEKLQFQIKEKDKMIFKLLEIVDKLIEKEKVKEDFIKAEIITEAEPESSDKLQSEEIIETTADTKNEKDSNLPEKEESIPEEKPVYPKKTHRKKVGRPLKHPELNLSNFENIDESLLLSSDEIIKKMKEYNIKVNDARLRDLKSKNKIYAKKDKKKNLYYLPSVMDYYGAKEIKTYPEPKIKKDDDIIKKDIEITEPENSLKAEEPEEPEFISVKEIIARLADMGIHKSDSTIRQLKRRKDIASKRAGNFKLFNWSDIRDFYSKLYKIK